MLKKLMKVRWLYQYQKKLIIEQKLLLKINEIIL